MWETLEKIWERGVGEIGGDLGGVEVVVPLVAGGQRR